MLHKYKYLAHIFDVFGVYQCMQRRQKNERQNVVQMGVLTLGGAFFSSTRRAWSTRLEKRGPMGT